LATGSNPESLAIDPAGLHLYAANVTATNEVAAYSITPSSGALTPSGAAVGAGAFPINIALDPSGSFAYVANEHSADISVYAVNSTTGALTLAGTFAAGNQPRSIAIE
jgi:6-phosphogluconolactonase (cycloisomerase 2 family)